MEELHSDSTYQHSEQRVLWQGTVPACFLVQLHWRRCFLFEFHEVSWDILTTSFISVMYLCEYHIYLFCYLLGKTEDVNWALKKSLTFSVGKKFQNPLFWPCVYVHSFIYVSTCLVTGSLTSAIFLGFFPVLRRIAFDKSDFYNYIFKTSLVQPWCDTLIVTCWVCHLQ